MLDLGWSELLIIGVVALIVVGPKDLPKMLRTLGQYAGRAKGIARDFQRSMDDAASQADIEELREVKKGLDDMRDAQHKIQRDLGQSFLDSPSKPASKKSAAKKAGDGAAAADVTPEPVKKPAPKSAAKSAAKSAPKSAAKPAPKAAAKAAAKSAAKPAAKPAGKPAKKLAKKVSEPRAEPGNVSGA